MSITLCEDEGETDPTVARTTGIRSGAVVQRDIVFRGVRRCRIEASPVRLFPNFMLADGEALFADRLHHNFPGVQDRYASLFAEARDSDLSGLKGELILIGGHSNFYHFITNYLTRVAYHANQIGGAGRFLVAHNMPAHYYDYFALIGVKEEQLLRISGARYTLLPRLVARGLPHYSHQGLHSDANAFAWLRNRLGVWRAPAGRRRIMLSRRQATHRRIMNEAQLIEVAARFGFEQVFPEDHSVTDLLAIMRDAQIMITPYGAGATNVLFCPRECRVIELAGGKSARKYNTVSLCAVAGQPCFRVQGREVGDHPNWAYRDLRVGVDDFKMAIEMAIASLGEI